MRCDLTSLTASTKPWKKRLAIFDAYALALLSCDSAKAAKLAKQERASEAWLAYLFSLVHLSDVIGAMFGTLKQAKLQDAGASTYHETCEKLDGGKRARIEDLSKAQLSNRAKNGLVVMEKRGGRLRPFVEKWGNGSLIILGEMMQNSL